ncbi:MAG: hypothetical protein IPF99_13585 [Deltaproteobacteria bacterium]|nr:hypothetical protein [Deltaproteobacteria bacterium]
MARAAPQVEERRPLPGQGLVVDEAPRRGAGDGAVVALDGGADVALARASSASSSARR